MIQNCLYVMLGGALGALARYCVAQLCAGVRLLTLPVGTFAVNIVGCFLLGLLTGLGEHNAGFSRPLMLLLTTGFCGAFTTFSTFSGETVKAAEAGQVWQAAAYVAASIAIGFLFFWWGRKLGL